jgi:two-component system CheB/CheR fusion protein
MDLISCRNLLIYLAPSLQQRIIATFGYALQPNGCLILGSSETLGSFAEHFRTLDEPHRIYCKKAGVLQDVFRLSEAPEGYRPRPAPLPIPRDMDEPIAGGDVHKYVDKVVLSRYGPAGLVVNETLKVGEYRGDMRPYLAGPENQPDAGLMSMLRQELRAPVSTAIEGTRRTGVAVVADGILGPGADGSRVAITVVPFALPGAGRHFLILFARALEKETEQEVPPAIPGESESAAPLAGQDSDRLQQELRTTREYLQSVIEELRSTNEEAQSANEELQSTNEELQTSKEELQSANEELHTINAEMQSRNTDLARLNDDLVNLFSSMNTPIMITGGDLRIRRFTPMAEKVFRLIAADVGRPIADLKPRINVPDLEEILQRVVDTLLPHEQEVQDQEGRQYLLRVRPYRTGDNRIDGTVLQLADVSDLKRSLKEVKHARDYAETIVNTVREPLVVLDQNLAIRNANRAFYLAFGLPQNSGAGQSIYEAARGRFDLPEVRGLFERLDGGSEELNDVEIKYQRDGGEPRILSLNARRLQAPGQKRLILMAFEDITERKRAAEARYRRVFDSARDGIVLGSAASGEITDVNPFTEQLLGYPRDELVGRNLWRSSLCGTCPECARPSSRFETGVCCASMKSLCVQRKAATSMRRSSQVSIRRAIVRRSSSTCAMSASAGSSNASYGRRKSWKAWDCWLEALRMISTTC